MLKIMLTKATAEHLQKRRLTKREFQQRRSCSNLTKKLHHHFCRRDKTVYFRSCLETFSPVLFLAMHLTPGKWCARVYKTVFEVQH